MIPEDAHSARATLKPQGKAHNHQSYATNLRWNVIRICLSLHKKNTWHGLLKLQCFIRTISCQRLHKQILWEDWLNCSYGQLFMGVPLYIQLPFGDEGEIWTQLRTSSEFSFSSVRKVIVSAVCVIFSRANHVPTIILFQNLF